MLLIFGMLLHLMGPLYNDLYQDYSNCISGVKTSLTKGLTCFTYTYIGENFKNPLVWN